MIRVLIAEDQAMLRGALAAVLGAEPDLLVVADVERGDEVVPAALSAQPAVAVLDAVLPGLDGIAAAGELARELPACRSLILTAYARAGYLRRAADGGLAGFLLKTAGPADLASAIRRVAAGDRIFDPDLAVAALAGGANPLTPRERDVLRMSARGTPVQEVARRLHLSSGTVYNHLSIAIQKLHATNRFEAASIAEERGWL